MSNFMTFNRDQVFLLPPDLKALPDTLCRDQVQRQLDLRRIPKRGAPLSVHFMIGPATLPVMVEATYRIILTSLGGFRIEVSEPGMAPLRGPSARLALRTSPG
jgi:hypothetical protein